MREARGCSLRMISGDRGVGRLSSLYRLEQSYDKSVEIKLDSKADYRDNLEEV